MAAYEGYTEGVLGVNGTIFGVEVESKQPYFQRCRHTAASTPRGVLHAPQQLSAETSC